MFRTSLRAATVALAAAAVLAVGAGTAAADPVDPNAPGGEVYNGLDDLADRLTCDGPLGGLVSQLANCDPEDEPPFTSVPDEEFSSDSDGESSSGSSDDDSTEGEQTADSNEE